MTALAVANRLGLDPYEVAAKASLTTDEFAEFFGISFSEAAAAKADLATAPTAAPTAVVATVSSPTAISLAFTAPTGDGGSPITGYVIVSVPAIALTYDQNDATSPIAVTGAFASATAYTFTARAKNAVGNGPASAASAAVTPNP